MTKVFAFAVVLAIAASAQGSDLLSTHTLTGTKGDTLEVKVYYETTKTVLGVDYDIFSVELEALAPAGPSDYVSGFDVEVTPQTDSYMLSVKAWDNEGEAYVETADMQPGTGGLLLDPSIDTHFNVAMGWSAQTVTPDEVYGPSPSILGYIPGNGDEDDQVRKQSSLFAVAAMLNEERANPYKFLNVVVPHLEKATLISYRDNLPEFGEAGAGETFSLHADGIDIGPIPEPATLGLLAIGVLGLLRRRRR